jgi:Tol biopolymer transport system component
MPTAPIQKIVYISPRNGNNEIFVMNADGQDRKRLTKNDTDDLGPDWSPDGSKITFSSNGIHVMNANGNNSLGITSNILDQDPDWSPDGSRIVFWSVDGIFTVNSDGSNLTTIVAAASNAFYQQPAWSPNGNRIAFSSNVEDGTFQIYLMDANGSNQKKLTNGLSGAGSPAWSPDGSKIAFQALNNGAFAIFVMNENAGRKQRK